MNSIVFIKKLSSIVSMFYDFSAVYTYKYIYIYETNNMMYTVLVLGARDLSLRSRPLEEIHQNSKPRRSSYSTNN